MPAAGNADRAELDTGIPEGVGPGPHDVLHLVRARVGGEIQVGTQPAQHRVAHTAADQIQLAARGVEAAAEPPQQVVVPVQRDQRTRQQRGVDIVIAAGTGSRHVR